MSIRVALMIPLLDARSKKLSGWMGWKNGNGTMMPTHTIDDAIGIDESVVLLAQRSGLLTKTSSWKKVYDYTQSEERTVWFELQSGNGQSNGACLPDPLCLPVHVKTPSDLSFAWQQRDLVDIMELQKPQVRELFVTTALPYANANFHMGHIMEYTQADIWVRFQRMNGHLVHFVCADDAHGAPIMLAAEKEGISPQAFVDQISKSRPAYLNAFHIHFDHWHSTDGLDNHDMSKSIYRSLRDKGLISKKMVEQFFDTEKQMFLPDRFIKGQCPKCGALDQYGDSCEVCSSVYTPVDLVNPYSVLSKSTPIRKSSEHYFFQLSDPRCVEFLEKYIQTQNVLQPEVLNKIQEWFVKDDGVTKLKDWDISRDAPYFGIEIPDAPGKFFYVWLDAPIGYLATLKHYFDSDKAKNQGDHRSYSEFMSNPNVEQIHFIGKDITYFHTLFWPAMLKFSEQKLPDHIYVHGFMTVNGKKMSKSRGTGIDPMKYVELGLNTDHLRYYLASKLNSRVEDVDFNPVDFTTKVNGDLIGKYINIASRSAGFIHKRFGGRLTYNVGESGSELLNTIESREQSIREAYDRRDFAIAAKEIFHAVDTVNAYIDQHKPWEMAKDPTKEFLLHQVCSTCIDAFRMLSVYLKPVLPGVVTNVEKFLQIEPLCWGHIHQRLGKHLIERYEHLSQRVQLEDVLALFDKPEVVSDNVLTPTVSPLV